MAKWAVVTVCAFLGMSSVQAQPAATRGPEVSQLSFYVGKWSAEGESRASAAETFGPLSGQETCGWFSGGESVVCRESLTDRSGKTDSLYILAYDADKKVYTVYGTDNKGAIYTGTGSVNNGTWQWTAEAKAAGSSTPMKYTFRPGSEGARTMDVEVAAAGDTWTKILGVTYKPTK